MANSNGISGALGSIIGYIGAEVAEPIIFEKLLWPQRFLHSLTPTICLRTVLLTPMGGPLHKAALGTLDKLHSNGLYRGTQTGHMLGTAFFSDLHSKYRICGSKDNKESEVRNGLLISVLRHCNSADRCTGKSDEEADSTPSNLPYQRTLYSVYHLTLTVASKRDRQNEQMIHFTEDTTSIKAFITIVVSEISAVICAMIVCILFGSYWFGAYLILPILLKILALQSSVRREGIVQPKEAGTIKLFEILDPSNNIFLIQGPDPIVQQFFRHYGHPIRLTRLDRLREVIGIALIICFAFYFPIALLAMLWVREEVQTTWLAYQFYTVIVYYIARFVEANDCGRLEVAIAGELSCGNDMIFVSGGDNYKFHLESRIARRYSEAMQISKKIQAMFLEEVIQEKSI